MLRVLRQPRYWVLLGLAAALAAVCIGAGVWQIHRYHWKKDADHMLVGNAHRAAVPAAELLSTHTLLGKSGELREVTAQGRYDAAGQLVVRQRQVNDQPAMLILTPLRTDAGPVLLVVRGWIPASNTAAGTVTPPAPPTGVVRVTARVYPSEPARSEAGLPTGQVERLNVPAISARLGTATYGAYAALTAQTPAPKLSLLPPPDLTNPAGGAYILQHLAYVVQWFIFAAIALAGPFLLARIDARRDDAGDAERRRKPEIAAPVANHSA